MADADKIAADNKQTAKTASSASTSTTTSASEANANALAGQPGGSAQADTAKPADPNPELSVGGDNPSQGVPATGSAGNVSGVVGQTVNAQTTRHPSEGAGYSPKPAENTGYADTNGIGYEQAVQRLAPLDSLHDAAHALGTTVVNIPPGSRPMMVDPQSGVALAPPQVPQPEKSVEAEEPAQA